MKSWELSFLWKVENFHKQKKREIPPTRFAWEQLIWTYLWIFRIPRCWVGFLMVLLPGPNQHISEMILKNSNCIFKLCRILAGPLLITSTTPDLIIPLGITLRTRILALLHKKTKLHARFHISLNYLSLLRWTLVLTWLQIFFVLFSS